MFTASISCQEGGWELADNTGSYFTSVFEEDKGSIIATMAPKDNITKIVKLDINGNLLKEGFVTIESFPISIFKIVFFSKTNKYMLLGSGSLSNINNSTERYFIHAILDQELNVEMIEATKFEVLGPMYNMNYLKIDDGILLSINIFSEEFGQYSGQIFLKINEQGEIINSYVDVGENCYSIIKSLNGYQCIGTQIKEFDSDFNLIAKNEKLFYFIGSTNQNRAFRLNDDKILIGALPFQIPELSSGGAVLNLVDNEFNILKRNWIKTEIGPVLPGNVFDISPDSSIFIATHEAPFTGSKSFSIGKFDTHLNLVWQIKYEKLQEFRYQLWGMEATNDNGIIIYGSRRKWNNSNSAVSYIIKFNSQGKLVFAHNIHLNDMILIKSYPNPSSGPLTLDIKGIGNAEIRIFDMLGHNVYVQDVSQEGETSMDLSALTAGTYVYKIYQGSKEMGSGLWVKQ